MLITKINFVFKVIAVLSLTVGASFSGIAKQDFVRGEILVAPKAGVSQAKFKTLLNKVKGKSGNRLAKTRVHIVNVPEQAEMALVKALSKNPMVEFAELNRIVTVSEIHANDKYYANGWHLKTMGLPDAWEISKGEGVVVAVLDTGVYPHSDLSPNLLSGYNSASNNFDSSDIQGHGTYVAGVIAATSNNNLGVTSVAWDSQILPIRVTNSTAGSASLSDISKGLIWAADHNADIANISFNIGASSTINTAAQYFYNKGGLVVVSAGNSGTDLNCTDNPYLITVSATDSNDVKPSWSDYGNCVDVAAPGVNIYTINKNNGYSKVNGTSFSAPNTAAVLALIKSKYPQLSNVEQERLLEATANDNKAGGFSAYYGHGRIDAAAALTQMISEPNVDQIAPIVTITTPENNSNHSGQVEISVDASDNIAVDRVSLIVNGDLLDTDLSSPYQFVFDSSSYSGQQIVLSATAIDSSNNLSKSDDVLLIIDSVATEPEVQDTLAPVISLSGIRENEVLSRNTTIQINAVDDNSVVKIELFINNALIASQAEDFMEYGINIKKLAVGEHLLNVKSFDQAGNISEKSLNFSITSTKGKGRKAR